MAKDTSKHLQDVNNAGASFGGSNNRQWRLQKERLHDDFTKALNSFQAAQKTAAQKEKEFLKKAKAHNAGKKLERLGLKDYILIDGKTNGTLEGGSPKLSKLF